MRKIFVCLIIVGFLLCRGAFAEERNSLVNDQANLYYAENRIEEVFGLLLTIPEENRTPMNWLLLGNVFTG